MSDIVKYDSLDFTEIQHDIESFLSLAGELDMSDFNQSSTVRRITSALAGLYNHLRVKIDNVRKESIMDSAIRPDSIKYLAMSQLSYSPTRRIAPQHPLGKVIYFKSPLGSDLNPKSILGNIEIDGQSYPISLLDSYIPDPTNGVYVGRLCIGEWKEREYLMETILQYRTPFYNFRLEDARDVIDDSGTVSIDVYYNVEDDNGLEDSSFAKATCVSGLHDLSLYSEKERQNIVLVKNSFFGGLDINFGDGYVFGNLLYTNPATRFVVHYLETPGFIPNLAFIPENISWDSSFVDEDVDLRNEGEIVGFNPVDYEKGPWFDFDMANGIDPESTGQIKTLSPYVSMANQRIMTNDDFITRVRRIPNIKSAYSIARHIDPGQDGAVSPLVPTATFELSGLTLRGVYAWNERETYRAGDIVNWYKDEKKKEWVLYRRTDVSDTNLRPEEKIPHAVRVEPLWEQCTVDDAPDYQQLTQTEWDINYHQQFNFDDLLGFMRIRVMPAERFESDEDGWDGDFIMTVQIAPYARGGLTPNEINARVHEIILSYCWELGAFLDVGELVSRINDINGVEKVYLKTPIRNFKLHYTQYIKPNIDITYTTETVRSERFGHPRNS